MNAIRQLRIFSLVLVLDALPFQFQRWSFILATLDRMMMENNGQTVTLNVNLSRWFYSLWAGWRMSLLTEALGFAKTPEEVRTYLLARLPASIG
jgi:hypothetical protein